jgi:hypothetical protein
MSIKILQLLVIFVVLFSLQGFSQTTDSSKSPLLDKYYPQAKEAPVVQTPVAKPVIETKQAPAPKPAVIATPIASAPKPVAVPVPQPVPAPVTAIDTTAIASSVNTEIATPQTTIVAPPPAQPQIKPELAVSDSVAVVKPVVSSAKLPVPKIQPSQTTKPYSRNRLGSSSPLYDTYEKNNYGAGSVTTGAK